MNLAHEVHLAKGCYTGQEALQRLITYDSVRRRLARVEGAGVVPAVPGAIAGPDGPAGVLTSTSASEPGSWIGLAVLKHEALASGASLRVEGGPAIERIEPFELTRPEGREGAAP